MKEVNKGPWSWHGQGYETELAFFKEHILKYELPSAHKSKIRAVSDEQVKTNEASDSGYGEVSGAGKNSKSRRMIYIHMGGSEFDWKATPKYRRQPYHLGRSIQSNG